MTKRFPRAFLIAKPRVGTIVMVMSNPDRPLKGVVTGLLLDSPDRVQVTNLVNRETLDVPYRELTTARC
jgi:hypothetical protein